MAAIRLFIRAVESYNAAGYPVFYPANHSSGYGNYEVEYEKLIDETRISLASSVSIKQKGGAILNVGKITLAFDMAEGSVYGRFRGIFAASDRDHILTIKSEDGGTLFTGYMTSMKETSPLKLICEFTHRFDRLDELELKGDPVSTSEAIETAFLTELQNFIPGFPVTDLGRTQEVAASPITYTMRPGRVYKRYKNIDANGNVTYGGWVATPNYGWQPVYIEWAGGDGNGGDRYVESAAYVPGTTYIGNIGIQNPLASLASIDPTRWLNNIISGIIYAENTQRIYFQGWGQSGFPPIYIGDYQVAKEPLAFVHRLTIDGIEYTHGQSVTQNPFKESNGNLKDSVTIAITEDLVPEVFLPTETKNARDFISAWLLGLRQIIVERRLPVYLGSVNLIATTGASPGSFGTPSQNYTIYNFQRALDHVADDLSVPPDFASISDIGERGINYFTITDWESAPDEVAFRFSLISATRAAEIRDRLRARKVKLIIIKDDDGGALDFVNFNVPDSDYFEIDLSDITTHGNVNPIFRKQAPGLVAFLGNTTTPPLSGRSYHLFFSEEYSDSSLTIGDWGMTKDRGRRFTIDDSTDMIKVTIRDRRENMYNEIKYKPHNASEDRVYDGGADDAPLRRRYGTKELRMDFEHLGGSRADSAAMIWYEKLKEPVEAIDLTIPLPENNIQIKDAYYLNIARSPSTARRIIGWFWIYSSKIDIKNQTIDLKLLSDKEGENYNWTIPPAI